MAIPRFSGVSGCLARLDDQTLTRAEGGEAHVWLLTVTRPVTVCVSFAVRLRYATSRSDNKLTLTEMGLLPVSDDYGSGGTTIPPPAPATGTADRIS